MKISFICLFSISTQHRVQINETKPQKYSNYLFFIIFIHHSHNEQIMKLFANAVFCNTYLPTSKAQQDVKRLLCTEYYTAPLLLLHSRCIPDLIISDVEMRSIEIIHPPPPLFFPSQTCIEALRDQILGRYQ